MEDLEAFRPMSQGVDLGLPKTKGSVKELALAVEHHQKHRVAR